MVRERSTTVHRSRGESDEPIAFKPFQPFNRFAPFQPSPLSSPATRGKMKEEYMNNAVRDESKQENF